MKKNLKEIALIAEILSAIAIVVSLIFVGVQIQQNANETSLNTKAIQINAYQDLVAQLATQTSLIVDNAEFAEIARTGNAGEEFLNETDSFRFIAFSFQVYRQGSLSFEQYKNGIINEQTLFSILSTVNRQSRTPLGREVWLDYSSILDEGYVEYVNAMGTACVQTIFDCGIPEETDNK